MAQPLITLLTDFGARDPSAGILHGVILGIAPDARIIDISHDVHKYAIRDGALLLWCALHWMPIGLHVAVVDPGVGTERLPVAIATTRGDVLVGPDNGLLVAAAGRLGGIDRVHVLEAEAYRLPVVSASFHGRDIFAPAAAHLSLGVRIQDLGPVLDPARLVPSPIADPIREDGALRSTVVYVDTFGNVKLAGLRADLEAAVGPLRPGDRLRLDIAGRSGGPGQAVDVPWQGTFGEVEAGAPLVYEDSYGRICVAASLANAADLLGLVEDQGVTIRR